MGQYFVAVNHTKKEYACPWCLGGTAKLWEWCAQPTAAIFPYLLRKSTQTGGGDIADPETSPLAGSWAGDQVELVGDYDESEGFQRAFAEYTNISPQLAAEYNGFAQLDGMKLQVGHCGSCGERAKTKTVVTQTVDAEH
jgi:hypothetical protein